MYQAAHVCKSAGFLVLGGMLLSSSLALGADDPPLSEQLTDLGRQALSQRASDMAKTFFEKALALDPSNDGAARGLKSIDRSRQGVVRVAYQDPKPGAPAGDAAAPAAPAPGGAAATPPPPLAGDHRAERGRRKYRPAAVDQRRRTAPRQCPEPPQFGPTRSRAQRVAPVAKRGSVGNQCLGG